MERASRRRRPRRGGGAAAAASVVGLVVLALVLWLVVPASMLSPAGPAPSTAGEPASAAAGGASAAQVASDGSAAAGAPPARRQVAPLEAPPLSPAAVSLEGPDTFRLRFKQPPRAGLLFDLESGAVLWRHHPVERLPIASLTKIMTALLVVDSTTSRDRAKVTRAALAYREQGIGLLPRGRRVPVEALLTGMLLISGNDAAIALADHVGGNERRFVRLMNQRARRLGLSCTHFVSAHGLEPGNRSCPADLAAMARLAMDERRIARVVGKRQAAVRFPIRGGRLYVNSTNPLVLGRYPGAIGLKTGYTERAGRSFVGVAERGRRTLGVVLLHSPDPARQARKLLTTGFRQG